MRSQDEVTLRCGTHHLLGCALCGRSNSSTSLTPRREVEPRDIRTPHLIVMERKLSEVLQRALTPEERSQLVLRALRSAHLPDFDIGDVGANLLFDAQSKQLRGRVYEVRGGTARCPKCEARVSPHDLVPCSGYEVRLPNFGNCRACGGEEEGCEECNFKGWVIRSWTRTTAYLACQVCIARLREPTKRGSASNFTTSSRAGEEYAKRAVLPGPLCTACQQRRAQKRASVCSSCAAEAERATKYQALQRGLRREAELTRKVEALKALVAKGGVA